MEDTTFTVVANIIVAMIKLMLSKIYSVAKVYESKIATLINY